MNEETKKTETEESKPPSTTPAKPKRKRKPLPPADPFNPRMTRKLKKDIESTDGKIDGIVRHIRNVQDNCILMGEKLIAKGMIDFGKDLIARGFRHDNSKFYGIEWMNMAPGVPVQEKPDKLKLKLAVTHHNSNRHNDHHPECWYGGIHAMSRIAIAEMVCDWKARSEEFGSSLRDWIANEATKRFKFTEKDPVYAIIMEYVDMICEKPFTAIKS